MSELLTCPFCGGEARILEQPMFDTVFFGAKCVVCGAEAAAKNTEAEAIEAWNTRAERTCHIVKASRKYVLSDGTELFDDGCSECNTYICDGDNYCSGCGAKVVSE